MAIFYWLSLIGYLSLVWLGMCFLGINWYKLETRYKYHPQRVLVSTYILNFFIMFYVFSIPFVIQFVINCFEIFGIWLGS
jgi:hypothetical protein